MTLISYKILLIIYAVGTSTTTVLSSSNLRYQNKQHAFREPIYRGMTTLYGKLLTNYDIRVRPRYNLLEPVNVSGILMLHGVCEFDTASQKLSLFGYFIFSWMDDLLVWNSSLYGGIEKTYMPDDQTWKPNLRLSIIHGGQSELGTNTDTIHILSNGTVVWSTDDVYNIMCDVNVQFYPFDKQNCEFYLYVLDTPESEINITDVQLELSSVFFKESGVWKIVSIHSERITFYSVATIIFNIEVERRHAFITATMICPLVLLSVINVGVFLVPVECGEKGSIGVTIFLSYGVFITKISEDLPHNSLKISYILVYMLLLLILSVIAVVYAYIQSYIFGRYANDRVTSRCLRKLLSFQTRNKSEYSLESGALTWNALLRRMDTIVFTLFFLIVLIGTPVFFVFLSNGSTA